jgi:cytochrome oxidase Cu insertion factor (SCO1/SenC/PrrC family)
MRLDSTLIAVCALLVLVIGSLQSCDSNTESIGGDSSDPRNCLPELKLTDQSGREISLASLKGKPVLFDFIYTTCPGPCLVLTQRMKAIADNLGADLGTKVWMVSVTVDPEHDRPAALRSYAKEQGAERPGWFFLTGPPAAIDRLMTQFKLTRQRESDGTVDHVLEFFLIAPDGRPLTQYLASDTNPAKIAGDLKDVIAGRRLAEAHPTRTGLGA